MSVANILVVDDDPEMCQLLSTMLGKQYFQVETAYDGFEGMEKVQESEPDLVVLDVMMPEMDGWETCRRMKAISDVPILFLTARVSESDRITGLEIGADDYVTKPFSPKELVLRIGAILKRTRKKERSTGGGWVLGGDILEIDEGSHRVFVNRSEVSLTAAEWKILLYLVNNPGLVITRDRILGECLDYMAEGSERTVDTHMKNIRKKLGASTWIETVREYGYRFAGQRS